jgi:iron complex transport system substrate-binding protein
MVGVFIAALLCLLAACGNPSPSTTRAAADRPVTLVDDGNRKVILPRPARRVISLVPSVTETIVALGAGDRLVGRTRYDRDTSLARLPVVGGGQDPSLETMVGLTPDLVVSWFSMERPETRRSLDAAGITTLDVSLQDTSDAFRAIALLGRALGETAEAERVLERLRDSLDATRRLAAAAPRPRVFYVVYNDPPMTMGPETFIAQILDLAGGDNVFDDATTNWVTVSLEEVVRRDPDIVVLPVGEMPANTLDRLRTEAGWRELRAVQSGCVVQVDVDVVNRPGPNLARAAEQLRVAIHRDGCAP